MFYQSFYDVLLTFIYFLTGNSLLSARAGKTIEKALWNFMACLWALKIIWYLWFYLAQLDDSNTETVQIYRKSVLWTFLRCIMNIHLIFDKEKFAFCMHWWDNWKRSLKFCSNPASFEEYSISLGLVSAIGWFKHWNSPNLLKKCFIKVLTVRH